MAPKNQVDFDISFEGGSVRCRVQRGNVVTVDIGPGGKRHTVKKRAKEDAPAAALRKLSEVAEHQVGGSLETSSNRGEDGSLFINDAAFLEDVNSAVSEAR